MPNFSKIKNMTELYAPSYFLLFYMQNLYYSQFVMSAFFPSPPS